MDSPGFGNEEHLNTLLLLSVPVMVVAFGGFVKGLSAQSLIGAFSLGIESALTALAECLSSIREILHSVVQAVDKASPAGDAGAGVVLKDVCAHVVTMARVSMTGLFLLMFTIFGLLLLALLHKQVDDWTASTTVDPRIVRRTKAWLTLGLGNIIGSGVLVAVLLLMKGVEHGR